MTACFILISGKKNLTDEDIHKTVEDARSWAYTSINCMVADCIEIYSLDSETLALDYVGTVKRAKDDHLSICVWMVNGRRSPLYLNTDGTLGGFYTDQELRDFASNTYDGGYRSSDIEELLLQFGVANKNLTNPITRAQAEKVCEILQEFEDAEGAE